MGVWGRSVRQSRIRNFLDGISYLFWLIDEPKLLWNSSGELGVLEWFNEKKNAENHSKNLKSIRTTNIQFVASASRFLSYLINSIAIDHGLHPAHFQSETKKNRENRVVLVSFINIWSVSVFFVRITKLFFSDIIR